MLTRLALSPLLADRGTFPPRHSQDAFNRVLPELARSTCARVTSDPTGACARGNSPSFPPLPNPTSQRIPHDITISEALRDAKYILTVPNRVWELDECRKAVDNHNARVSKEEDSIKTRDDLRAFCLGGAFHLIAEVKRPGGSLVPARRARNETYFRAPAETWSDIKRMPFPIFDGLMAFNLDFLRKGLDTLGRKEIVRVRSTSRAAQKSKEVAAYVDGDEQAADRKGSRHAAILGKKSVRP